MGHGSRHGGDCRNEKFEKKNRKAGGKCAAAENLHYGRAADLGSEGWPPAQRFQSQTPEEFRSAEYAADLRVLLA